MLGLRPPPTPPMNPSPSSLIPVAPTPAQWAVIGQAPSTDLSFSASLVGKEMVDYICQYLSTVRERRVTPDVRPGYLRGQLPERAPEEPDSWDSIFGDIERIIMPGVRCRHHRVILDAGV